MPGDFIRPQPGDKDPTFVYLMAEKKTFEEIRQHLETFLKPGHFVNDRYSEQNYWMMSEQARHRDRAQREM